MSGLEAVEIKFIDVLKNKDFRFDTQFYTTQMYSGLHSLPTLCRPKTRFRALLRPVHITFSRIGKISSPLFFRAYLCGIG